jgi:MinD-like ATPase involved in chromosome partitioning or flagellar assembly
VLVDANLLEPSLSVALDLNPALNVSMIVHEAPGADPARWAEALSGELQPLDAASTQAVVLCGAPKPGLRAALGTAFLEMLLQQLRLHYAWIVADLGDRLDEGSPAGAGHRAILAAADRVLVVATPDLVGLRRAASLIELLRAQLGETASARVALVLNRHDRRHHHDPVEVAQALGVAVAAAIPDDRQALQRALADQRPVVAFGRGRRGSAARALLDLAQLVERGSPGLPAAASGLPIVAAPAARVQERPPARSRWAWRRRVRLPWVRKGRPA